MVLPSWLEHSLETLRNGGRAPVFTNEQRREALVYANAVSRYNAFMPSLSDEAGIDTAAIVLSMAEVFGPRNMSDAARHAWGEAYSDALHDIPTWAVRDAMIRWHRGECGNDASGEPFNYDFAPKPAALRKIANEIVVLARWRARKILEN